MGEQENWAAVTFTETWGMFKEKIKKKTRDVSFYVWNGEEKLP